VNGGLIIDKPEGWTSHDVVGRVRRLAGTRRVGHTGTLDPFATGVLVVCLGRATRLSQLLVGVEKEYVALVRLGWATDTQDRTGEPLGPPAPPAAIPDDPAVVRAVLAEFEGEQEQVPPMYSAKKIGGKALYTMARKGIEIERAPVRVRAHMTLLGSGLRGMDVEPPRAHAGGAESALPRNDDGTVDVLVRVVCSAGTYVRTLAHDAGARLGCGAHLRELRRVRSGQFGLERAVTLEALEGRVAESLVSPSELASALPAIVLTADEATRVGHGSAVALEGRAAAREGADCRLEDATGALLAIARVDLEAGLAKPRIVLVGES
jgi:tRNA pseudouridine55 synthase